MRGTKAKMLRKKLGQPIPRIRAVEQGTTVLMVAGKPVVVPKWVPQDLTDTEKAVKAEYRKLKKQYNRGEL